MHPSDLEVGAEFSYRKARTPGGEFLRVRFLQYAKEKRQAQVEHVEGQYEGLREWVRPTTIHCEWSKVKKLVELESKQLELERSEEARPVPKAVSEAANIAFAAAGEDLYVDDRGVSEVEQETLERLARRAGIGPAQVNEVWRWPSYKVERGEWAIPARRLIPLAQRFASAEPGVVNMYVEAEQHRYREAGYQVGERYMHSILIEHGPAYALVREWAGANRIADDLKADNDRLRKLMEEAVRILRSRGHEREARRFERELHGV
jgi:hypothetical protein